VWTEKTAPRPVGGSQIKSTSVISRNVRIVSRTRSLDICVIWRRYRMNCHASIIYYLFFMILKPLMIKTFPYRQTLHFPNLVCFQQFCTQCEMSPDLNEDCARCGKREHSFWDDPIGDLLSYLCELLPWVSNVVAIAHTRKLLIRNLYWTELFEWIGKTN